MSVLVMADLKEKLTETMKNVGTLSGIINLMYLYKGLSPCRGGFTGTAGTYGSSHAPPFIWAPLYKAGFVQGIAIPVIGSNSEEPKVPELINDFDNFDNWVDIPRILLEQENKKR